MIIIGWKCVSIRNLSDNSSRLRRSPVATEILSRSASPQNLSEYASHLKISRNNVCVSPQNLSENASQRTMWYKLCQQYIIEMGQKWPSLTQLTHENLSLFASQAVHGSETKSLVLVWHKNSDFLLMCGRENLPIINSPLLTKGKIRSISLPLW